MYLKKQIVLHLAFLIPLLLCSQSNEEMSKEYRERITLEKINNVYIPKNLSDAFTQLDKLISAESKKQLLSVSEEVAARKLHFSFGRWMIVNWSFYEGSRFSHYLKTAGVTYPDDMADFMIIAYHRHLRKADINVKELATRMKKKREKENQERIKRGKVLEEKRQKKQ